MDAVPDYLEPVLAWRTWRVAEGGVLQSVTRDDRWPVGEPFVADCRDRGHVDLDIPGDGCTCGIYGARRAQDVTHHTADPMRRGGYVAIGLVSLWGVVIEGEHGWRASHAYPHGILLPIPPRAATPAASPISVAQALVEYGVPVEIINPLRGAVTAEVLVGGAISAQALRTPEPVPV